MIQKKLDKIAGYLYSIEFDYNTMEYHAIAIFPVHWKYVIPEHLELDAKNNTESLMFRIRSKNKSFDEIYDYIEEIVKANVKIDTHNQKLKERIEAKKLKLLNQESELSSQAKMKAEEVLSEISEKYRKDHGREVVEEHRENEEVGVNREED